MLYSCKYEMASVWKSMRGGSSVARMKRGEVCFALGPTDNKDYVLVLFNGVTGWVAIQNLVEVEDAAP